jgi:FkbM family methyltransferase
MAQGLKALWRSDLTVTAKLARSPLRLLPSFAVVSVRAGNNKGRKWVIGSAAYSCAWGSYEPEIQGALIRYTQSGVAVWDVGANCGFHTLSFSRQVGANGKVYAFEPVAANITNIQKHLALNAVGNVTVISAALNDRTAPVPFQCGITNATGKIGNTSDYYVMGLTADAFIEAVPSAVPSVIKIDIEGAESAFLKGAERLLTVHSPILILALHGDVQRVACCEALLSHGYRLHLLSGESASVDDITKDVLAINPRTVS